MPYYILLLVITYFILFQYEKKDSRLRLGLECQRLAFLLLGPWREERSEGLASFEARLKRRGAGHRVPTALPWLR